MDIEKLKMIEARRFAFLENVFESSEGDSGLTFSMWEVGKELGYPPEETERIANYLVGEGLLKYIAATGVIAITHQGIKEIESGIRKPTIPTPHFPLVNVLYVHSMQNSQVQQGTLQSSQAGTLTAGDLDSMRDWIEKAQEALPSLGLGDDDHDEMRTQLATIRAQLQSKNPRSGILREAGKSIRSILEGAVGNAAGTVLLTHLLPILGQLG